jgi:type I restriction enzyme S subunit
MTPLPKVWKAWDMAREWKRMTLRQAGVRLFDCEHKTPTASSEGIPYIAIPQMKNGRLDPSEARLVAPDDVRSWNRRVTPTQGDIILSRRTNPGVTAVVPPEFPCVLGQNLVILRSVEGLVDQSFLRWLLQGQEWWDQIQKFLNVGAVFDSLRCADIPNFELTIPSPEEQRAISHILGTLDDKIDLNRRMAATLEEMAEAVFRERFVSIDALPPDWRFSTIGAELQTLLGGTPSRAVSRYWGGDIPWINSGKANEFRIIQPTEYLTEEGLNSSATKLLPCRTTVIAITGATLGQVSLTEIATCANQSVVGVLGSKELPSEFVYLWIREHIQALVSKQTGGAQQHVNKGDVDSLAILCPSPSAMDSYLTLARPLFDRIALACRESVSLAEIRDTLLPKLISGDLRVKDAEQFLKEAV